MGLGLEPCEVWGPHCGVTLHIVTGLWGQACSSGFLVSFRVPLELLGETL